MKPIVFVVAHADDLELGAGGTCAMLAAMGHQVHVVVTTDNPDPVVCDVRRREAITGAGELGVQAERVHFLGIPFGLVRCSGEVVARLRGLLGGIGPSPAAVFTHSEADSHQDHVETARLARACFRETVILKFAIPSTASESGFAPSLIAAIDPWMAAKERALRAHSSQWEAGRIRLEPVRAFAARWAKDRNARYAEPFELEIQHGARDVDLLIDVLDSSPFTGFWAPIIATGGVTVLAPPEARHTLRRSMTAARGETMSDAVFLTRLQARLFGALRARLADAPANRFVVHHASGAGDARYGERGHLLILGGAPGNPAAEQMTSWLGLARLQSSRRSRAATSAGLLTFAVNPLSRRDDARTYMIGVTGDDRAATMAAAACLLEDAKLQAILPEVRHVLEGRLAIVEIEVPPFTYAEPTTAIAASR